MGNYKSCCQRPSQINFELIDGVLHKPEQVPQDISPLDGLELDEHLDCDSLFKDCLLKTFEKDLHKIELKSGCIDFG